MGKILLFYKYVTVKKPSDEVKEQKKICSELGLTGRILIAQEGINGTVGGTDETTNRYKDYLNAHATFCDMDIKESEGGAEYFPRLRVCAKSTIVNLGIDPKELTAEDRGTYLSPEEAHALITQNPAELMLFDARNDFEWRVGTFRGAHTPSISNFRDLPQYIDEHADEFKDKRVLMFCTGGIRCERATAYLKNKQVAQEVFHIKGGIQRYIEAYPDGYFRGKNYVFDSRVTARVTEDILAHCDLCKKPYDDYSNCINAQCNKHIIICPDCVDNYHNTCSERCAELVKTGKVPIRRIPQKFYHHTSEK
jgi:predicted sulfurtransferase